MYAVVNSTESGVALQIQLLECNYEHLTLVGVDSARRGLIDWHQ